MEDRLEMIIEALKSKACNKQKIYRNTLEVFTEMKKIGQELAVTIAGRFKEIDTSVLIEFKDISDFEFHISFSGDLLIFQMHSNVVTFPEDHILSKSPYVLEDLTRGYFGHIMVYNFMADSVRYNRLGDPGYLLSRMLLNNEKHFYIEGVRQLNFLFPDIGKNDITAEILRIFIESNMLSAMEIDLMAPQLHDIAVISLQQKITSSEMSGIEKVGFDLSASTN